MRRRFRSHTVLLGSILALGAVPLAAQAQYVMVNDPPPRYAWSGRVGTDFRNEFDAKSDAGDAFDAWRTGIEGDFGGPINQSMLAGLSGRYAHSSFDFDVDAPPAATYGGARLPRDPFA